MKQPRRRKWKRTSLYTDITIYKYKYTNIHTSGCRLSCRVDLCCVRDLPQGKDDVTGEPLVQHEDNRPEALMARLRHYKDVAKPVMDLYKSVHKTLVNMPDNI